MSDDTIKREELVILVDTLNSVIKNNITIMGKLKEVENRLSKLESNDSKISAGGYFVTNSPVPSSMSKLNNDERRLAAQRLAESSGLSFK